MSKRQAITEAVISYLHLQQLKKQREDTKKARAELQFDERFLALQDVITNAAPCIQADLIIFAKKLEKQWLQVVTDMPIPMEDYLTRSVIRGKLEEFTDSEFEKYTIEELASLVRC